MSRAILRLPDVKERTGLSRSSIYKLVAEGTFPRPVHLGPRAVGWVESEIEDWLTARIDLRDVGTARPSCPSAASVSDGSGGR